MRDAQRACAVRASKHCLLCRYGVKPEYSNYRRSATGPSLVPCHGVREKVLNPNYLFAYIILAIAVTTLVVRLTRRPIARWIAAILSITTFWLFGHIDDFLGAREHRALCAKEAGVKVYKKANLPQEFYNADGTPNFMRPEGPDWERLHAYIEFERFSESNYPTTYLRTDKHTFRVTDARNKKVLAEKIDYFAWPSPFIPSIGHARAIGCPQREGISDEAPWAELYQALFRSLLQPSEVDW
jgi:hypothetical protein